MAKRELVLRIFLGLEVVSGIGNPLEHFGFVGRRSASGSINREMHDVDVRDRVDVDEPRDDEAPLGFDNLVGLPVVALADVDDQVVLVDDDPIGDETVLLSVVSDDPAALDQGTFGRRLGHRAR